MYIIYFLKINIYNNILSNLKKSEAPDIACITVKTHKSVYVSAYLTVVFFVKK